MGERGCKRVQGVLGPESPVSGIPEQEKPAKAIKRKGIPWPAETFEQLVMTPHSSLSLAAYRACPQAKDLD